MKRLLKASSYIQLVSKYKESFQDITLTFSTEHEAEEFCIDTNIDSDRIYYDDGEVKLDCTHVSRYPVESVDYSFIVLRAFGKKSEYAFNVNKYTSSESDYTSLNKEYLSQSRVPNNCYIKKDSIKVLSVRYSTKLAESLYI